LRTIQNCNSYNEINTLIRFNTLIKERSPAGWGCTDDPCPHELSYQLRTRHPHPRLQHDKKEITRDFEPSERNEPDLHALYAHHRNFSRFALRLVFLTGFVSSELSRKTSISQASISQD
jgi:hypothetical protein